VTVVLIVLVVTVEVAVIAAFLDVDAVVVDVRM
jgi:hypothetical protein